MLGLALIAALILWIVVIVLSVWLPQKIFKDSPKVAGIATAIGFMLTCGFWVAKWNIESIAAQKEAREMCKQAGVTIYVQPEKWKEMVGGEEAWKELGYLAQNAISWRRLSDKDKKQFRQNITFEGRNYEFYYKLNDRVLAYHSKIFNKGTARIVLDSVIYYDFITNTILYKENLPIPLSNSLNSGFAILFIKIPKCKSNQINTNPTKHFFYFVSN